jgi:hypothetical protein
MKSGEQNNSSIVIERGMVLATARKGFPLHYLPNGFEIRPQTIRRYFRL